MALRVHIAELDCQDEVNLIRRHLETKPGIAGLTFDVVAATVDIDTGDPEPSPDQVLRWLRELGMTPSLSRDQRAAETSSPTSRTDRHWDAWLGSLLLVIGLAIHAFHGATLAELWGHAEGSLPLGSRLCYLATVLLGIHRIGPRAWAALRLRRADMHVLMVLAVAGALLIDQWLEAAVVVWLFIIALQLESRSVQRARHAIAQLLELTPPRARCAGATPDEWLEKPVDEVPRGARIQVRPGDRVPLDGEIESGVSDLDQSALTGESVFVSKQPGDAVFAGTINQSGTLIVRVTQPAVDSMLAKIVALMQQAQQRQARVQRWVDRFAEIYTPATVGLALLLFLVTPLVTSASWSESLYHALVLLVIACPCALVISTPVSLVAALACAARQGVLIKGGDVLEWLTSIDIAVFDKTGTLTRGTPQVSCIEPRPSRTSEQVLELAARLEVGSQHPFSEAIQTAWQKTQAGNPTARAATHWDLQVIPGAGIEAEQAEGTCWIGNRQMLARQGVSEPDGDSGGESARGTRLWVGRGTEIWGSLWMQDAVREDAAQALRELKQLGVSDVRMFTGDTEAPARDIAAQLGLDHWQTEMLPQDKSQQIQQLTAHGQRVAMIGDGINDSVAMAEATVGVAMGRQGADIAVEAADLVLMGSQLLKLPWVIRHARRTRWIIQQNVILAIATKLVFLVLATVGWATLWMAIAADMGTSLVVIANALRLLGPKR